MENKTKKQMLQELKQTNAWAFKHLNNSRSLKDVKEIYEGYFALHNNTQEIESGKMKKYKCLHCGGEEWKLK